MEFAFRSILSLLLFLTPLQDCLADSGSYDDELTFIDAEGVRASLLPRDGSSCSLGYCHSGHVCQYRWGFPYCDTYSAKVGATCDDNPCEHGGTCQPDGVNNYRCDCPADVYGYSCQTGSTLCASVSCNNGGTCITVSGGGARCHCADNFTGTMCEISCSLSCLNGGNCERTSQGQTCVCLPGYYGMLCENGVCSPNPCLNGATCEYTSQGFDVVSNYRCNCPPGFTGSTCAVRLNACALSPCLNGGTCVDNFPNSYRCSCPPLYFGANCELLCSLPCQNGGSCTVLGRLPTCACPAGYSGTYCTFITACEQAPCLNGGTCNPDASYPYGYKCDCTNGFTGRTCEDSISCSLPCSDGGFCQKGFRGDTCVCLPGYFGLNCERNVCSPNPCLNGGSCEFPLEVGFNYRCNCAPGFIGSTCAVPFNACASSPCLNGGTCYDNYPIGYSCSCLPQFGGNNCDQTCTVSCQNGGSCQFDRNGFQACICPTGYTGYFCDESPCDQYPCLNGGTCFVDPTQSQGYRCNCANGFTGSTCGENVVCNLPCFNGGSCQIDPRGDTCVCLPGYVGLNCEDNVCSPNPCLNGGSCAVSQSGFEMQSTYMCSCPKPYFGANCELLCSLPCQNGGSCTVLGGLPTCACPPGYSGTYCTVITACEQAPCLNGGTCNPDASYPYGYNCSCLPQFGGNNCDQTCTVSCQNGGSCQFDRNGFQACICPTGYTGYFCDESPCDQYPCVNGGTCVVDPTQSQGFRCSCPRYFTGSLCQNMPTCSSSPCLNGGICVDDPSSDVGVTCLCSKDFTGKFCERDTRVYEGACSSNPCLGPNCQCLESCKHEHGYYCMSQQGYIGQNCDIGPPTLTCHHDKIELEVSAGFYNEYDDTKTSFMYFSSTVDGYKSVQACQAQPINGKYRITILSPFTTSCGTTRTQALNSHTYNNTLWINRRTGSSLYDMPFPVLDWSCTFNYDLDVVASLQPVIDVQRSKISGGHQYTASVSLCKVSSCQRSCPPSLVVGAGAIYTVSETIHLSINFKATHLFPTSSFTDVARTFLSCSQDPSWSGEIVPLSDTGCDLNSPLDVRAGSSSSQHAACMSFNVPRFHQCTTIYIHLRLRICSSSDVTTSFCSNGDRVQHCPSRITKRSTRDDDITYHVIGPITIVDKGVDTIEFVSESGTSVVVENVSNLELQEPYQASHPGAINTPFLATIITLFISIVLLLFISILCVCRIGKRSKFI